MNMRGAPVNGRPIPPQVWQLDAASLSDANKALRILPRELRPYSRGIRMVGRAVTVTASADLVPVLAGLEQCGAGDILVVDAGTTSTRCLVSSSQPKPYGVGWPASSSTDCAATPRRWPSCRCPSTPSARFRVPSARAGFQSPNNPFASEMSRSALARFWSATTTGSWSQRCGAGGGDRGGRSDPATRGHDPVGHPGRHVIVRAAELRRACREPAGRTSDLAGVHRGMRAAIRTMTSPQPARSDGPLELGHAAGLRRPSNTRPPNSTAPCRAIGPRRWWSFRNWQPSSASQLYSSRTSPTVSACRPSRSSVRPGR